jgi:molybdopterin molybdotransferase
MPAVAERLLTYDDAYRRIMETAAARPMPAEGAPLADLPGRVLAEDLHAPTDIPAAANSAMDGYCVRHADIAAATATAPAILPVAGHIDAGHPLPALPAGHAAYIATGGLLPEGADTVVKLEDTERLEAPERVVIRSAPPLGTYIRKRGKDMQAGALVLGQGQVLGPFEVGIVAALGRMGVQVRRRPRVALLTSGDELVMPFDDPQPWQVRNANSPLLAAAIRQAGGEQTLRTQSTGGVGRHDRATFGTAGTCCRRGRVHGYSPKERVVPVPGLRMKITPHTRP